MKASKGSVALYGGSALLIGAALGLRHWSDIHQPPVHPLKLKIVEKGIPLHPLHSVSERYYVPGELRVDDNMKLIAQGRPIEGGVTTWELINVQQRAVPNAAWAPPNFAKDRRLPPLPFKYPNSGPAMPYANLHTVTNQAGEWKVTVRASRRYYDANTKEEWIGSAQYELVRTLKEDVEAATRHARGLPEPTFTPPPGTHPFDPDNDYVAGIQWSDNGKESWHDIPQKGQPGFPLIITADAVTGFKAKKKDPAAPWPNWVGENEDVDAVLNWSGQIHPDALTGESVWISPDEAKVISIDEKDFKTVNVSCGNTVTRQMLVAPPVEFELELGTPQAMPAQTKALLLPLTASVDWQGSGWHPPTKIRFIVEKVKYQTLPLKKGQRYADTKRLGTPIGQVNKPGISDDLVVLNAYDKAHAMLTLPGDTTHIEVRAVLTSSQGGELALATQALNDPRLKLPKATSKSNP